MKSWLSVITSFGYSASIFSFNAWEKSITPKHEIPSPSGRIEYENSLDNWFKELDETTYLTENNIKDIKIGDFDSYGNQLRPDVVWFSEPIYRWFESFNISNESDVLIVVGTSGKVFPAAGLITTSKAKRKFFIDPNADDELKRLGYEVIHKTATEAVRNLVEKINENKI